MTADDVADFAALSDIGINLPRQQVAKMAAWAMDDNQSDVTAPSMTTPCSVPTELATRLC